MVGRMMEKTIPAIAIHTVPVAMKPKIPGPVHANQPRVVGKQEYKEAAASLARAFKDDDVAMYFIETDDVPHWTPEEKWDLHLYLMECLVYAHILKGLVTAIGPEYDCVALW